MKKLIDKNQKNVEKINTSINVAEVIEIIRKKTGNNAGLIINELIQIACGIAFECFGDEEGYKGVLVMIEKCYEYSKKHYQK